MASGLAGSGVLLHLPLSLLSPQGCKRSLRALGPQGMGWLWLSTLESLCERSSQAGRGESIAPTLPGLGSCLLLLGASCEKVTVAEVLMGISLCHVSTLTLFWLWSLGASGALILFSRTQASSPDFCSSANTFPFFLFSDGNLNYVTPRFSTYGVEYNLT